MMLFAIVGAFMFCNSVDILDRVLEICEVGWDSFENRVKEPLMHFFFAVNSATNALFYCIFGDKFRSQLWKALKCKHSEPLARVEVAEVVMCPITGV